MDRNLIIKKISDLASSYNLGTGIDFFRNFCNNTRHEDAGEIGKLFIRYFSGLTDNFLIKLEIAANYYYYSLLATDKMIDEINSSINKEALLLSFLLREKSLHDLYHLFESGNHYWIYFEKYYKEYLVAISFEINDRYRNNCDITIEEMEFLYAGKAALAKALITAMALKVNNLQIIEPIEKSIDYYHIALCLYDDLQDWKEDWNNDNHSYLLKQVFKNNNLSKENTPNIKLIGKYIFFSGEAINILDLAIDYHQKAINIINYIDCQDWKDEINRHRQKCMDYKEDIEIIVRKELIIAGIVPVDISLNIPELKLKFKQKKSILDRLIEYSLNYITQQWKFGHEEAKVYNYFAHKNKFLFKKRYHSGDVFQRAVICDNLFDLNFSLNNSLLPYLQYESNYLINKTDNSGWWNFYNNFEYQPCDADTTAQVLQILIKMELIGTSINMEKSIDSFLEWHTNADGGIGTWFLPPRDLCNEKQLTQRSFYKDYIGLDVDSDIDFEVMANLLYALNIYNPIKYSNNIKRGLQYIEKNQKENGFWVSSWYFGAYYGTYVCLRLLVELLPESTSILSANEFILKTQNEDGGWGWDQVQSDPLNTAYALISLKYVSLINKTDYSNALIKAFSYLINAVYNKENLDRCKYINFQIKDHPGFTSNSVTHSYVLKAIDSWKDYVMNNQAFIDLIY